MNKILFGLTTVVGTIGIQNLIDANILNSEDIGTMLAKHTRNIDDNEFIEDREFNLQNVKEGIGRILSVYEIKGNRIYINSYLDKVQGQTMATETTIMLCDEY